MFVGREAFNAHNLCASSWTRSRWELSTWPKPPQALAAAPPVRPARKATNVTLPEPLLREAKELGIALSQACERGLAATVAEARAQRWLEQNRAAIEAWNEYVAQNGLPLAVISSVLMARLEVYRYARSGRPRLRPRRAGRFAPSIRDTRGCAAAARGRRA